MFLQKQEFIYLIVGTSIGFLLLMVLFFLLLDVNMRLRSKRKVDIYKAVIETEENERNRIAQDLHDEINAVLSAIKMELENAILRISSTESKSELLLVADRLNSTIQDVRAIARNMSSAAVKHKGLINGIENFGNAICANAGIRFSFFHEPLSVEISENSQSSIYRILQESIINSIKHSGCTEINLSISVEPEHVFIEYSDNGKREVTNMNLQGGMGLVNIRSRVNLLHGKMVAPEDFSSGTQYTFSFLKKNLK